MPSNSQNLPTVSYAEAREVLLAGIESNVPVLFVGAPGVGKTSLVNEVFATLSKAADKKTKPRFEVLSTFLGSTVDSTDVCGIPVVREGRDSLDRVPLAEILAACQSPAMLFMDEISCCTPTTQAALLRVILERKVADRSLHAQTYVAAACNPPEQAPGGFELSAPMMGRLSVYWFEPTLDEIRDYFATLGDEGTVLRTEAADYAATLSVEPRLLQINPPAESVTAGKPWAAPRSIERALKLMVAAKNRGASEDLAFKMFAGNVGEDAAVAYFSIRKMRKELPSIEEIVADPLKAKVPDAPEKQIAAVGLTARVADKDVWAAWAYGERLRPEISMACSRVLLTRTPKADSPHAKIGAAARIKALAKIQRDNR